MLYVRSLFGIQRVCKQSLTLIPTSQRPREKLLRGDPLTPEELFATIIGSGVVGRPVHLLSSELSALLKSGVRFTEALTVVPGLGRAARARLLAAHQLSGAFTLPQQVTLSSPDQVSQFCSWLAPLQQEHFLAVYLSARSNHITSSVVSIGTISSSLVHPREAFSKAIVEGASGVVFVHNHPSGDLTPSDADIAVTKQLVAAGALLGIPVVDHLIISSQGFTSLKVSQPALFW